MKTATQNTEKSVPKLTIDQLKNYLGTALKWKLISDNIKEELWEYEDNQGFEKAFEIGALWEMAGFADVVLYTDEGHELQGFLLHHPETGFWINDKSLFRPICYRLSDLDKFIPELGFVPIEHIDEHHNFSSLRTHELMTDPTRYPFTVLQALFQWHFWPFDQSAFDEGLVIDKLQYGKEVSNG